MSGAAIPSYENSTNVALGLGGVFTGAVELCRDYKYAGITSLAAGADGILVIEGSADGSAWYELYVGGADAGVTTSIPALSIANAKYYRCSYTNSGEDAQTAFRLSTNFYRTAPADVDLDVRDLVVAQDALRAHGAEAEGAAATAYPIAIAGRYDATPRAVNDGDVAGLAVSAAGEVIVTAGTGATGLGKAEDAAHTTGDVGVMSLAVRNDTLAALAGTDGDYAPLQVDAVGALYTASIPKTLYRNVAVVETAVSIVSTAGRLWTVDGYNPNATVSFLKIYDTGTATIGTTATIAMLALTPNTHVTFEFAGCVRSTGLSIAVTSAAADASTGAPAAAAHVNLTYT